MAIDPQISEICRRIKITDYLAKRGVDFIRRGNRYCCKCPLPTHDDHSPSCYIRVMPDGAEVFKCFGCGESGNIITLLAAIDGESKGKIVKKSPLKRVSSSRNLKQQPGLSLSLKKLMKSSAMSKRLQRLLLAMLSRS